MAKNFATLKAKPGGPFDQFRRNLPAQKMPKDSNTYLYDAVSIYGVADVINNTVVNIGNYVYRKGVIHALNMNVGRSIPWIEDGLKSGERRVLFIMHKKGVYGKKIEKVASITGAMIESVYPHGEGAANDTIYRLGRKRSIMIPYITAHSNFGNMEDMRAASPRYADCTLSPYAMDCFFSEIGSIRPIYDTKDNYKYDAVEPVFLTSKYPNSLMQWNLGIGKGAAACLGAFNSRDIFKTAIAMLDDPNAKVDIYPDLPVPVDIINKLDLKGCFDKAEFKVKMRAQYEIINDKKYDNAGKVVDKHTVVFTSLPLNVTGAVVKGEIIRLKDKEANKSNSSKKFPEIMNVEIIVQDKTPGGISLIVEYEKGYDPEVLAEKLFKSTSLGKTASVNYNLITDNKPDVYTPRQIMNIWITQRYDQKRRFYHQKALFAAKERAKLEAVCIILQPGNIDKAINIIKSSKSRDAAAEGLSKEFGITDFQSRCVLEIKLMNLTHMDIDDTKKKLDYAIEDYKYYRKLLTDEDLIKEDIRSELEDGLKKYGKERRAVLKNLAGDSLEDPSLKKLLVYNDTTYFCLDNADDLSKIADKIDRSYKITKIRNQDMVMIFNKKGVIKVLNGYAFSSNTQGISLATLAFSDVVSIISSEQPAGYDDVILVTEKGYGKVMEFSECTKSVKGKVINLNTDDNLAAVIPSRSNGADTDIVGMIINDQMYYAKAGAFPRYKRSSAGNRVLKLKADSAPVSHVEYFDSTALDYILIYGESGYIKLLDTAYLGFTKRGNDSVSLQGKNIIGAIGLKGNTCKTRLYDTSGKVNITLNIDKSVIFEAESGETQKFKMSTSIGSPVKVFKKAKYEFYCLM